MLKGIDVSDNNGRIDWQAVKQSGINFAIIRLGFGNDDTSQDDKRFAENVSECERLGIPWGANIYSYAMDKSEALSEANHCLRLLNGKKPSFPVCFDMEDADRYKANRGGLSKENAVTICETFLSALEERGYYVALYASLSWLNGILNDRRLDRFDKWVAQWNTACEYGGSYGMWQYGGSTNYIETPYLNGVSGAVDKNYAYYDYPDVIKSNGLNGWEVPVSPEVTVPEVPETEEPETEAAQDGKETEDAVLETTENEKEAEENAETVKEDTNKKETEKANKNGFFKVLIKLLKLFISWIKGLKI